MLLKLLVNMSDMFHQTLNCLVSWAKIDMHACSLALRMFQVKYYRISGLHYITYPASNYFNFNFNPTNNPLTPLFLLLCYPSSTCPACGG